jgi:hypothetical protein
MKAKNVSRNSKQSGAEKLERAEKEMLEAKSSAKQAKLDLKHARKVAKKARKRFKSARKTYKTLLKESGGNKKSLTARKSSGPSSRNRKRITRREIPLPAALMPQVIRKKTPAPRPAIASKPVNRSAEKAARANGPLVLRAPTDLPVGLPEQQPPPPPDLPASAS